MLKLVNVRKVYQVADLTVNALDGIDLCFRKNEFVSILGPSGCGKTTTLNIIGGLDKYTSGDLVINGVSTKEYKDHDWDVYRNHHIGFVFQSYNLIPHQTILGNVELALTISGVSKKERQERAKKALDRVGLANQYHKKPNQLSGGQCQRVAIARALVNEPDILLADEPTGALDTHTSIQIMELIKEISKEKLVIMVTHNPELAEKYSTRIVRLLDGKVQDDSNPCSVLEEESERKELDKDLEKNLSKDKAKMSFWTAFKLSSRNLYTKFKRTFMVALAGCIGIVGVSTVLAVSNGVQNYINDMENDMLSGNPVYITTSSLDYGSIMGGGLSSNTSNVNPENDKTKVFINSLVNTLVNMNGVTSTNNISDKYMDFLTKMPEEACELVQYKYGYQIAPNIYTTFEASDGIHKMSVAAIQATYASVLENVEEFASYSSMISSVTVMTELPSKASYLANQYDVVYIEEGMTLEDVINNQESLIAVVSKNHNTLNDLELAEYGFFSQDKFLNYCYKMGGSDLYNENPMLQLPETIDYETLAKKEFTWYPNDTVYKKGSSNSDDSTLGDKYYASAYSDGTLTKETDSKYDDYKFEAFGDVEGKVDLNVKCVLKLKEDLSYGCLSAGGLYYTNALTKHMREYTEDSEICKSASTNGSLYNVELGYNFRFDGNSSKELKSHYLTGGNSAIMDYIQQFISVSGSSSNNKKVTSYSLASLGGAKNPSSVYFYCNDFAQKDLLTAYLDKWNDSSINNLYKVDTNGFYVGHKTNEAGKDVLSYYYYDEDSKSYYNVEITDGGYAKDKIGNQYKLIKDEDSGKSYFYLKLDDELGEKFEIEGKLKLTDNISINAYTLASYVLFGDEFSPKENVYGKRLEQVPNKGENLYRYKDADDNYRYLMKVKNQTYYKINLDVDGNVVATRDGYKKYRFDSETKQFYSLDYVVLDYNYDAVTDDVSYEANKYYYLNDKNEYEEITNEYKFDKEKPNGIYLRAGVKSYKLSSDSPLDESKISSLYSEEKPYNYANGVKNPTFTINGEEYTLDTKGLYIDTTSFNDMSSTSNVLNYIKVDTTNKIITIRDYSQFKFYYKDEADEDIKYFYVDYEEKDGVSYLHGKNIGAYIDSTSLGNTAAKDFISEDYIINDDGTLQSVNAKFSNDPKLPSDLVKLNLIGDKLTDLSILEIDDSLKISYTDTIGLIISMVGILIQIITYALIAFTALSLVVSTVMIGIITYVSVVERTKEIGIIRSIGGRKKDVSHLFNAETFIIGLAAGVLGVAITYLLSLIINLIVGSFTGIYSIAALPWYQALIMIALSVFLTLISGLIPAKSAASKDPVIALRTE